MLEHLFGDVAAQVLFFLHAQKTAYAREIAEELVLTPSAVQKQLVRLEDAGVLVSDVRGNVRLFTWNPRYPFLKQLRALLSRAMEYMPENDRLHLSSEAFETVRAALQDPPPPTPKLIRAMSRR